MTRNGSKPECWKKRLSSAEITAWTSTLGRSANFTSRRFSRFLSNRLVSSSGSSMYCVRSVLSRVEMMRDTRPPEKLMTPPSWSK